MTVELYPGYFNLGGNEIVNTPRVKAILEGLACAIPVVGAPECDTLLDGLAVLDPGVLPGDPTSVAEAPWYDLDLPDVSGGFYGVSAVDVRQMYDSTRESNVAEHILNGGTVGRARLSTREVVITAMLLAKDSASLEYGRAWLESATLPGACGQHGDRCGVTDLTFFTDCPPNPDDYTVDEFIITNPRRNLALNPTGGGDPPEVGGVLSWSASAAFDLSQVEGFLGAESAVRATRNATGNSRATVLMGEYAPSTAYIITASFRLSAPMNIQASLRPNGDITTGQGVSATIPVPAGESTQKFLVTTQVNIPGATSTLSFVTTSGVAGATMDITNVLLVASPPPVWTETRRNLAVGTALYIARTSGTLAPPTYPAQGTVQSIFSAAGNSAWWDAWTSSPLGTASGARANITEGQILRGSVDWMSVADLRRVRARCQFYDAAGAAIGGVLILQDSRQPAVGQFVTEAFPGAPFTFEYVAPAGAATAAITLQSMTGTPNASPLGFEIGDGYQLRNMIYTVDQATAPFFDGSTVPTDPYTRYSWTGTADASTSIEERTPEPYPGEFFYGYTDPEGEFSYSWAGSPYASVSVETRTVIVKVHDPVAYAAAVEPLVRYLHGAAVTSGPTTAEEYRFKAEGLVGQQVEFIVTSERPWTYGRTRTVSLPTTTSTVLQDVPFNYVPYPSAELPGVDIVVAHNYSANPSVETNNTGWLATGAVVSGTSPTAFLTSARTTDLAAVGVASERARVLGNNGVTAVTGAVSDITIYQDVTLPAGTNRRLSFNMWAAGLITTGTAATTAVQNVTVDVEWRSASAAVGTAPIGTAADAGERAGNAYSATGLLAPDTATIARVRAVYRILWSSSATAANNSDIRLYADALAVTVP